MDKNILIDDLETSEESMFINVTYKGIPFTGIAYEDSEYRHSEYSYLNGFGQGRCFSVYPNGQLEVEFILEKGETVEETNWYKSGIKKYYYREEPNIIQRWNEESILLVEADNALKKCWYPNGRLKSVFEKKKEFTYYGEDGEFAVKIKASTSNGADYVVLDKNIMTFNGSYINTHYMDLLQDRDFYKYFIIWLDDLEKPKQEEVICNMIKSDILWHKYDGINLASQRKIHKAIPYIKLEIGNNEKPPDIRSVDGTSGLGFAHTIAQRSEIALKELKK
ncbi:hypothetical protein FACS1894172_10900 [Spirochaetia bacterium]|nr:hypothetical protein FACS1894172_10900 [Spirochaetia bacterium]